MQGDGNVLGFLYSTHLLQKCLEHHDGGVVACDAFVFVCGVNDLLYFVIVDLSLFIKVTGDDVGEGEEE